MTAKQVTGRLPPGRHADGGGLYLVIDKSDSRRWVFLFTLAGRRREMGLGSVRALPLPQARAKAQEAREQVAAGIDPIEARARPTIAPVRPTFGEIATAYMADREAYWKNPKHRQQWRNTLEKGAASLWAMRVDEIATDHVMAVLRPIWSAKPETARRIRGRVERILDAARASGHRSAENPARWRGHLDVLLPRPAILTRGHHAAMPYKDVPAFIVALRARHAVSARALEFLILTAARSGEVRKMTWGEVDLDDGLWMVPADRMKAKRPHRVPLTREAVACLPDPGAPADLIWPGPRSGKPQSDMVFTALLKRMGMGAFTAHGFRSAFRDWAADETDHPREVAEAALAHLVGDATERAYRRGDALAKRRHLLTDWSAFVTSACKA